MKKQQRTYAVVAAVIIVIALGSVATAYFMNRTDTPVDPMAGMDHSKMNMNSSESDTYKKYAALKGEAYDKEFLANMIVYHESAMNMAEMARFCATSRNQGFGYKYQYFARTRSW